MAGKLTGLAAALDGLVSLDGVDVTAGLQGTPKTTADGESQPSELVEIGTVNEYGSEDGKIPSRPFMRTAVARYGVSWVKGWDRVVSASTRDDTAGMDKGLRFVGIKVVGDIQKTIVEGPWQENAEATKAAKRKDPDDENEVVKPLIDSGQMRQSIRSQVEVPGKTPVVVA